MEIPLIPQIVLQKSLEQLYTYEFQNLILVLMQVMEEKDTTYKQAINEIDRITELINQELETNKP